MKSLMLPGANADSIVAVSIVIAGIIIYALKENIMTLSSSGKVLRPVVIGIAAVAVLTLALLQPWSGPNQETVFARAYDAASAFYSYHMKISAYTWNPDGTGGAIFAWNDYLPFMRGLHEDLLRLKKFDAAGNSLWGGEGILVAASTSY